MKTKPNLMLLLMGMLILVVGCSKKSVEPELTAGELNLVDEFGGYTAAAEKVAFGDDDLLGEEGSIDDYDDPILSSGATDTIVADPKVGIYHFRAVWGRLRFDSTVTTVTDWTGSLTVTRGVEVVRRLIRFEEGQDQIVERTNRKLIEWVSMTTVHNDGIVVDLFIPPVENDSVKAEPVTLTFETGPYSRTFELAELMKLDTIVDLDDGNSIAFHAVRLDRFPCPRGFLAGRWGVDEEGRGRFRGFWMSANGRIDGYLRGHYGVNDEGRNLLFGKWISRSGRFEGFLKGTFGSHPDANASDVAFDHAGGWFAAKIFAANRSEIGILRGAYRSADEVNDGFFQGRWKIRCNNDGRDPSDSEEGF